MSEKNYDNFEKYFLELENISNTKRFGDIIGKRIIYDNHIIFLRGLKTKSKISTGDAEEALISVRKGDYDVYLGKHNLINLIIKKNNFSDLKIVGINAFQKKYAFVLNRNSDLKIPNRKANIFYRFYFWIGKVIKGEFGKTNDSIREIKKEIYLSIPNTLFLISFTIITIILFSLILSYLITSNISTCIKRPIEYILELMSSLPEFLVCFALLYLVYFYFLKQGIIPLYNGYDDFYYEPFKFSIGYLSKLLFYYSLPTIALSLSSGNISVLTKYLVAQIKSIKKSENILFLEANGMKKSYIRYIFILKMISPTIFTYIAMKIPLIVGSAVVVEKIFDLNGIGNMAFKYFKAHDTGIILMIFLIIYLITVIFDASVYLLNYIICPIKRKQTV